MSGSIDEIEGAEHVSLDRVREMVRAIVPVGSRVTCDPPPTGTDEDYLVLLKDGSDGDAFFDLMDAGGWERCGSEVENPDGDESDECFHSFRSGDINLIVTASRNFFRRFLAASSVAKRLNLLDKSDRIALFQAVLYGNAWEDEPKPGA